MAITSINSNFSFFYTWAFYFLFIIYYLLFSFYFENQTLFKMWELVQFLDWLPDESLGNFHWVVLTSNENL